MSKYAHFKGTLIKIRYFLRTEFFSVFAFLPRFLLSLNDIIKYTEESIFLQQTDDVVFIQFEKFNKFCPLHKAADLLQIQFVPIQFELEFEHLAFQWPLLYR